MNDQPTPPLQPQPSTQPTAPVVARKTSKKLIALFVVLGVLIVTATVGAIIYFVFFYISKADYRQAEAQTNSIISAYNRADATSDTYYQTVSDDQSTDAEIGRKLADYKTTRADYQAAIEALASKRALKNSQVKAAYDVFLAKNKVFMAYNDTIDQTMPTMRKIAVNCSESKINAMKADDLSQIVSAYDKVMNPCTDAMRELSASKNVDAATVGKKAVAYLEGLRTHLVAMQSAYVAGNRPAFESEYNIFMEAANSFSADTDISSIRKHQDSLTPDKSLNHLAAVIRSLE